MTQCARCEAGETPRGLDRMATRGNVSGRTRGHAVSGGQSSSDNTGEGRGLFFLGVSRKNGSVRGRSLSLERVSEMVPREMR